MMLATIVINNYNYGRFLAEAIESALAQSYVNTEVIVVDDGSTDDSRDIIARYDRRIVAVLKENGGQASAFNAGFRAARGDVVCFLDADDVLLPDAVRSVMPLFQDSRTAKAHWRLWIADEHGQRTGALFPPDEMLDGDYREVALRDGPLYDSRSLPPTSGNAWSRRFLDEVFPIPEAAFDHGADVYLHALAPVYGPLRAVREPQGMYRVHGGNHYWGRSLSDDKIVEYLGRFEASCHALQRHLRARGVSTSIECWKERSFNYLWLERLRRARHDLSSLVPAGSCFILVDDDEWGDGEAVPGRVALSLLYEGDAYTGHPADDDAAIRAVERRRALGARYIAFWWTTFWWFEQYRRLRDHLDATCRRVLDGDHLVVFDLEAPTGAR